MVERQHDTKLTAFFKLCAEDLFAQTLLYHQTPRFFTWQQATRSWRRRRRGVRQPGEDGIFAADAIGRVYTVSPRAGERFYLRLLLHNVRGPRSYEALRTVGGHLHPTYQEACSALGLLEDGQHWHRAMAEAAVISFPRQLRRLFALIAVEGRASCDIRLLWRTFCAAMSEDVRRRLQRLGRLPPDDPDEEDDPMDGGDGEAHHPVLGEVLRLIGHHLHRIGGLTLAEVGLPQPPDAPVDEGPADDAPAEDGDPPVGRHQRLVAERVPLLTADQRAVYEDVTRHLEAGEGGLLFLQAPGGEFTTLRLI